MSDEPAPRVRVTGPARRTPPRSRTGEIDEQTALGEVYLGSLLRVQMWLAVRTLTVLVVAIGSLPLMFHLFPSLAEVQVLGIPLAWPLLAVGVYPVLVLLGWQYLRRAERHERDFVDLMRVVVDDPDASPGTTPP